MAKKKEGGIVYSTNPDYQFNHGMAEEETLSPGRQLLFVWLDRKARKGKTVTLVRGFKGSAGDLEELARLLKSRCGTGGSAKDGEVILQGDFREKIILILNSLGYKVKKAGG